MISQVCPSSVDPHPMPPSYHKNSTMTKILVWFDRLTSKPLSLPCQSLKATLSSLCLANQAPYKDAVLLPGPRNVPFWSPLWWISHWPSPNSRSLLFFFSTLPSPLLLFLRLNWYVYPHENRINSTIREYGGGLLVNLLSPRHHISQATNTSNK